MNAPLRIKPHHLLDIIRDFGAGKKHQPHPYGHDVHRVASIMRKAPHTLLQLTAAADDICAPCRYLSDGHCTDTTDSPGKTVAKEDYNKLIDRRLFTRFGLEEGAELTILEFCRLASRKLGDIRTIYREADPKKTKNRGINLFRGLEEYLEANS